MFILLLLRSYLCYCIRFVSFRLIVCYAHVLYSSSMCIVVFVYCIQAHCVWSCSCIVFKLIMFLCCIRAHCVRLCLCIVYIQAHCVWSCSFIVFGFIMCVFVLFA